jgi:hypothetical protein
MTCADSKLARRVEFAPVRHEHAAAGGRARELAWVAVPVLAYLALLQRLWFNAPMGDDFDAILRGTLDLQDARSLGDWFRALMVQHNEHRIVVTRLVALALAELAGAIDFRILTLLGNLGLGLIAVLLWAGFRGVTGAPAVGAAAFLLCQMTFYEGALLSMAAISNIGVIAFAFACLFFALRPGRADLAWAILFGLLAAGSQGNGLFALPLAAAGCAAMGSRRRAWVLAVLAAALWVLYLATYQRPPHHPSPLEAFRHPFAAAHLSLVILGSIAPGLRPATVVGTLLVLAIAWLAFRKAWSQHPVAGLWIAFIVLSAAAGAAGRVGFGVFYAPRYAVNSSCLAAVVFLLLAAQGRWTAVAERAAFAAAAVVSLALSWWSWPRAVDYSFQGRLLARGVPAAPSVDSERYFGLMHPDPASAGGVLARSEERGLYRARQVVVHGHDPIVLPGAPGVQRSAGYLDLVQVVGPRVVASGWSDVTAEVPGRVVAAWAPVQPLEAKVSVMARTDVAIRARDPRLLFSGLRWEARYASEEEARRAAGSLCLVVQAPGYPATALTGTEEACGMKAGRR